MSTTTEENNNKWILGVVLGLLGSIAINTGNNVQSLGLKQLKEEEYFQQHDSDTISPSKKRKRSSLAVHFNNPARTVPTGSHDSDYTEPAKITSSVSEDTAKLNVFSSKIWMMGTLIFVTGSLLNFASYAFAAQSMLASLESIQFVTNILFGKFMLGARVTKIMYMGTFLTVTGTVVAVQFSSKKNLDLNTAEMKKLYLNPIYIAYLFIQVGLLFLLDGIYRYYSRKMRQNIIMEYSNIIMPCTYALWSALFGTQSVVQAKVLAELLAVQSTGQEKIFHSWFTYVTIIVWIVTVAVWLTRLNDALSKFNPLFIIPLLQCSFILFAIISGGIFFKEFNDFSGVQWLGFCFGVIVMFCGLALLTPADDHVGRQQNLPEDIVKYLINSGGVTTSNDMGGVSVVRPPSSPTPTPRRKPSDDDSPKLEIDCQQRDKKQQQQQHRNGEITLTLNDCSTSLGLINAHIPLHGCDTSTKHRTVEDENDKAAKRKPKTNTHNSHAGTIMESVRGAVIDSARETKKMMLAPNGTAVLTSAMSSLTEEKQREIRRRERVRQICSLIARYQASAKTGEDETKEEIFAIVDELKKEMKQIMHSSNQSNSEVQMKDSMSPKTKQHEAMPVIDSSNSVDDLPMILETRSGEKISMNEIIFNNAK